jgi:hypothetical protein
MKYYLILTTALMYPGADDAPCGSDYTLQLDAKTIGSARKEVSKYPRYRNLPYKIVSYQDGDWYNEDKHKVAYVHYPENGKAPESVDWIHNSMNTSIVKENERIKAAFAPRKNPLGVVNKIKSMFTTREEKLARKLESCTFVVLYHIKVGGKNAPMSQEQKTYACNNFIHTVRQERGCSARRFSDESCIGLIKGLKNLCDMILIPEAGKAVISKKNQILINDPRKPYAIVVDIACGQEEIEMAANRMAYYGAGSLSRVPYPKGSSRSINHPDFTLVTDAEAKALSKLLAIPLAAK